MPEAAEGGPLAIVRSGDRVLIDLGNRALTLQIGAEEMAARLAALEPQPPTLEKGWLALYQQLVQPLSKGAVLGKRHFAAHEEGPRS